MSGISEVAMVTFVRKRQPEIQYFQASITEDQREEYAQLASDCIRRIEAGSFPSHSGIRFPQNGCVSCSYLGLCLGNKDLMEANLTRRPGASELDWLDELA